MNITPIAVTDSSVTLSRADFEALMERVRAADAEDAHDMLVIRQRPEGEQDAEWVPIEVVDRLLAGDNRIKVWRQHRGMSQTALAGAAGISLSYLNEIESGKKPGSVAALRGLATALRVQIDDLVPPDRE